MKISVILLLLFTTAACFNSVAQNDSIYKRYEDKVRLESFSIIAPYVGFGWENNKDAFALNATFSYNRHLIGLDYLEIAFKNERNSNNEVFTRNNYYLWNLSYGYASVFNRKWRMHNTIGLGQIRFEKSRDTRKIEKSKGINLRLGSTIFYDIGKRFAAGAALGYNLNTIENIPELGLALTYKLRSKSESLMVKEKRSKREKQNDSIKVKELEKYAHLDLNKKALNRKINRFSFSIHFSFYDNLNKIQPHIAGLQVGYLFENNDRISLGQTGVTKKESNESKEQFRNRYRTIYLTYGKRFNSDDFFIELNTGLSYFQYNKARILSRLLGNDFETVETENSIGLPLIMRTGVYVGNHVEIGFRSDYQLNFVKPTFSTSLFVSYSF